MIIKPAEGRQRDIDALNGLLARPDVDADLRQRIQTELRRVQAGARGERDAAYEIDFHYAATPNGMLIHDLRLEVDGRVAQIDHLIVDRLLEVWVLESKHFSEGVAVDEFGEWVGFYQRRPFGIGSPIEQNRKHQDVLRDVFKKRLVTLPKRLGIPIQPRLRSLVLISKDARISRPKSKAARERIAGLESVIKIDQLRSELDRDWESKGIANFPRLVGKGEIERLARDLVALHRPMEIDWAARFGLPSESPVAAAGAVEVAPAVVVEVGPAVEAPAPVETSPPVEPPGPVESPPPIVTDPPADPPASGIAVAAPEAPAPPAVATSASTCEVCGRRVSAAVVAFCQERAEVFANRILCMDDQRLARRGRV